jgi:hypothetical protein
MGVVVDGRDGVERGRDALDERAGRGRLSGQPEGRRNESERQDGPDSHGSSDVVDDCCQQRFTPP